MTSPAALEAYRRRGAWLMARCAAATGNPEPGADAFARWVLSLRGGLRPSTWRLYRLSAAYALEGHPDHGAPAAADVLSAPATERARPPRRTSARRSKTVPPDDFLAILRALGESRSSYAQVLRTWIIATTCVGLRPCEWATATLDGTVLTVQCAKFDEGERGLDDTRDLDLAALPPDDLDAVRRMTQLGQGWQADSEFAAKHEACAALLRRTCAALWPTRPRRPTLYSFRHVFASNAKAAVGEAETSALLGHAATRTAQTHYGKRTQAWKRGRPPLPKPSPAAVAKVRRNARGNPWATGGNHPL